MRVNGGRRTALRRGPVRLAGRPLEWSGPQRPSARPCMLPYIRNWTDIERTSQANVRLGTFLAFVAGAALFAISRPTPIVQALMIQLKGHGLIERCRDGSRCRCREPRGTILGPIARSCHSTWLKATTRPRADPVVGRR